MGHDLKKIFNFVISKGLKVIMEQLVMHLAPGTVLVGNYRIERILGQGGFGITYLATDLALDRLVAIKEFYPKDFCNRENDTSQVSIGTANNQELVERLKMKFLKEARNIAKFNNPYIIKIYTIFEANNTAYYVMEYIEGENLRELVKRAGALPRKKALDYIKKIGKALEYVHSHHINHLDIKPANILIRKADDTPILIDFGLSKEYNAQGHQTSTTPTGISHGFAPIEQYNAIGISEFSPTTDLYSLAATLYFLLTGKVPPAAPEMPEIGLTFPNRIPENIQKAIARGMSFSRSQRHQSVREFLRELENSNSIKEERTVMINHQYEPSVTFRPQVVQPQPPVTSEPIETAVTLPPPQKKDSGPLKMFIIIGLSALVIILATIWITLSVSKNEPEKTENLEATEVPVYDADALPKDSLPVVEEIAEEVASVEKKEVAPRVLNDSPYPIAPGHHSLKGKADGNLPILVYIDVDADGNISGKMAYESTLRKYGNTADRYMYLNGSFNGNMLSMTVEDNKGNQQEWNLSVREKGMKYVLTGDAYSYTRDKTFSINISGE